MSVPNPLKQPCQWEMLFEVHENFDIQQIFRTYKPQLTFERDFAQIYVHQCTSFSAIVDVISF